MNLLFTTGPQNPDLYEVVVPVVDQQQCVDYYAPEPITDNMICAGVPEGGKDSCQVSKNSFNVKIGISYL